MVGRSGNHIKAQEGRLKRLAANIDALARKDAILLGKARDTAELRRAAAALHPAHAPYRTFGNLLHGFLGDGFGGRNDRHCYRPEDRQRRPLANPAARS